MSAVPIPHAPLIRNAVTSRAGCQPPPMGLPRASTLDIRSSFVVAPPPMVKYPEAQLREALRQVGKLSREDELDCGGCG